MDNVRAWFASSRARQVLAILGILILIFLIFHAGLVVGRRHGRGQAGAMRAGRFSMNVPRGYIEGEHGVVGTVATVSSSSIEIQTRDGATQTVLLSPATVIRQAGGGASSSALSAGDRVIVLGEPQDKDAIAADLIHIMSSVQ